MESIGGNLGLRNPTVSLPNSSFLKLYQKAWELKSHKFQIKHRSIKHISNDFNKRSFIKLHLEFSLKPVDFKN